MTSQAVPSARTIGPHEVSDPSTVLAALRTRSSEKWRRHASDVLPAHIAEMDVPIAGEIKAAISRLVSRSDIGYAFSFTAHSPAQAALARWLAQGQGWQVAPSQILYYADVMRVIEAGIEAFSAAGDAVVFDVPAYPSFFSAVAERGREAVANPLVWRDEGWRPDLAGLERAFRAGAAIYIVCNPHNPTGLVYTVEELAAIAELARIHGVTVLCDEVHSPLVYPGKRHVSLGSLPGAQQIRCLTALSASKGWNFAGLKCAFGITVGPGTAEALQAQPDRMRDGVGILGVAASEAAFTSGGRWLADLLRGLDRNRRALTGLLRTHGLAEIGYRIPDATYLAWLDCRRVADRLGEEDLVARVLRAGGLAVSDGRDYGCPGYLRLNLATHEPLMREAVRRLALGLGVRELEVYRTGEPELVSAAGGGSRS